MVLVPFAPYAYLSLTVKNRSEACKIFVGGLASEITEKEFGDYFSQYGIVKDAVVMVDRNTGSSRGFGSVFSVFWFVHMLFIDSYCVVESGLTSCLTILLSGS